MRIAPLLTIALLLAVPCAAQNFDNTWVSFEKDPGALDAGVISSNNIETDVAWADLDKDGFTDLVVVRKQPFTSPGKRTNLLLMNVNGVLTDKTLEFATASDVPGDQGFNTATNDRDVVLVDVDNDTWLDIVTATTISDGDPKAIGHPRIYMNLGETADGAWQGFEYQDARIPQLLHFGSGQAKNPRFCSVAAGDVNGDGWTDLYFGDYDSSGAGGAQQGGDEDLNDRLLINQGGGFFADESQGRMSSQMLLSAFGTAVEMSDMNLDGTLEIIKDTALNSPQYVAISYNNLLDQNVEGVFNNFDNGGVGSGAPYHIDVGDLNNDGRPDIITSDDGLDRYRFNTGNDGLGRAVFSGGSGGHPYDFIAGGDDGFASNNLIVDLDNDGWADTLHADVDVDIPGGNRRTHIYHNTGSEDGALPGDIVTLREERQQSGGGGWLGAEGLLDADLRATHDIAVFDIDNDGWNDLVISRMDGTEVYMNAPLICQTSLGQGGPGPMSLEICGQALVDSDAIATLSIQGGAPSSTVFLPVGLVNNPTPLKGGVLVPNPPLFILDLLVTNGSGSVEIEVRGISDPLITVFMQAIVQNGATWEFSNALSVDIGS